MDASCRTRLATHEEYSRSFGLRYVLGSLGSFKTSANLAGFSQTTPIQPSLDNGLTFIASLANPFPNGLLDPLGPSGGLQTNLGQNISFFPKDRKMPYAQRWSLGIEQEIRMGFVVEAAYVGNRGTRLPVNRDINATPAQYLSTSPTRDQATINYLGASFPNPFFGLNPQYTQTITRANLLRPYPEFGTITYPDPMAIRGITHCSRASRNASVRAYTLQLGYTWSKAMDAIPS